MNEPFLSPLRNAVPSSGDGLIFLRPEQIHLRSLTPDPRCRPNDIIRLSESIKRYGVIEPLSVRATAGRDGFPRYELVTGERRYRAACLAGVEKIPCNVLRADDRICAVSSVLERLQQESLNMFEQAAAFRALIDEYGLTQGEIARKLSMSQSAVANKLRLLRFSREEQDILLRGGLTERHARTLLRLRDPDLRLQALRRVRSEACNVAETEALVETLLGGPGQENARDAASATANASAAVSMNAAANASAAASTNAANIMNIARGTDAASCGNSASCAPQSVPTPPAPSVPASEHTARASDTAVQPDVQAAGAGRPTHIEIMTPPPPSGVCPRKFALQDLRPLYNSIDRTLSIFRKTGSEVSCTREEQNGQVRIVISIPKRS